MRIVLSGALCAVVAIAAPAGADTIVQGDGLILERGFNAFDPYFGTLTAVDLTINVDSPRFISLNVPISSRTSLSVGWAIDGAYRFRVSSPFFQYFTGAVPLTGSGVALVQLGGAYDGYTFGGFQTRAHGSASFSLDPSFFIQTEPFPSIANLRYVFGHDDGFIRSSDTLLSGIPAGTQTSADGGCGGSHDLCVNAGYTLTYTYTPTVIAAPVPEPATWGLMIVGFAAIGALARRRSGRRSALPTTA
jgi:PEP-CTERM motif